MLLLVFSLTLLLAVLISCKARESVLSVSVLFLVVGLLYGAGAFGGEKPNSDWLYTLAELALFSVLFTDGMNTRGLKHIKELWHSAGRALLFGMPLTIAGIAALAHWVMGMRWDASFLMGSILSPTDPVFIAAIFQFEAVPARVKHILNIESGFNDGLALPAVLITLDLVSHRSQGLPAIIGEMALGVALGVAIPWAGIRLERSRLFGAAGMYQRLNAFALGLVVLAVAMVTNANMFLAAFSAGITIATISPEVRDAFHDFGELVTELLKLAALLMFGALVEPVIMRVMPWQDYVFALMALLLVRPIAIELSFLGSRLPQNEVATIGWFGPKGFASVVYALLVLQANTTVGDHVARVSGLVITASIVLYSSTDILIARGFESQGQTRKAMKAGEEHRAA